MYYDPNYGGYDYWLLQNQVQQQQMYPNDTMTNYAYQSQHIKKTTRKDILQYLQQLSGASEIVQVDDFETLRTRHICPGSKKVQLLDKGVQSVPTSEGYLNVEYFLCPYCRKLILNKSSLEML